MLTSVFGLIKYSTACATGRVSPMLGLLLYYTW